MCADGCDNCKQSRDDLVDVDYSKHAKAMLHVLTEAKRMCVVTCDVL